MGGSEDSRGGPGSSQQLPPPSLSVTLNLPIYLCLRNSVTKFSIPYFHFMSTFVAVSVQTISIFYHFWGSVIRGYLTLISWAARGSRIMARSTGRESLESSLLQHLGSLPRSSSSARRSGSSYHGTEPWPRMAGVLILASLNCRQGTPFL